jgi:hypothetical protein
VKKVKSNRAPKAKTVSKKTPQPRPNAASRASTNPARNGPHGKYDGGGFEPGDEVW